MILFYRYLLVKFKFSNTLVKEKLDYDDLGIYYLVKSIEPFDSFL